MPKRLLSDELWQTIAPLLPTEPARPKGGRPRIADRAVLTGIIFVLRSGIPWEMLPKELGCGSGMTCWRRLQAWQSTGLWEKIWQVFLDRLGQQDAIDWSRAVVDSASVRAVLGGHKRAPIPRIVRKKAVSTTSSRMAKAFPWP